MAIMQVGPGGIETISGALRKPKKDGQHRHGNYVIATHRVAATTNPNCQRIYSFAADRYKRTTPLTGRESAARVRFATVRAAVYERAHDLMKVSADQQAFLAQKDLANGIKTMNAWYWKQEGDAYDAQHQ